MDRVVERPLWLWRGLAPGGAFLGDGPLEKGVEEGKLLVTITRRSVGARFANALIPSRAVSQEVTNHLSGFHGTLLLRGHLARNALEDVPEQFLNLDVFVVVSPLLVWSVHVAKCHEKDTLESDAEWNCLDIPPIDDASDMAFVVNQDVPRKEVKVSQDEWVVTVEEIGKFVLDLLQEGGKARRESLDESINLLCREVAEMLHKLVVLRAFDATQP